MRAVKSTLDFSILFAARRPVPPTAVATHRPIQYPESGFRFAP